MTHRCNDLTKVGNYSIRFMVLLPIGRHLHKAPMMNLVYNYSAFGPTLRRGSRSAPAEV